MYSTAVVQEFCKGDESLEDEECTDQPLEGDNNQLRGSSKLILLKLHEKLLKNSVSIILGAFRIWSKLERWKSLTSGCLMSWLQIKKIVILKCHLLLFYSTTNHFLTRLWHMTKSGFYTTTSNDQLSGWTEKKLRSLSSKVELAPKKGHDHCLVVGCPSNPLSFLNPGETIISEKYTQQIDEMSQKPQCLQLALVKRA